MLIVLVSCIRFCISFGGLVGFYISVLVCLTSVVDSLFDSLAVGLIVIVWFCLAFGLFGCVLRAFCCICLCLVLGLICKLCMCGFLYLGGWVVGGVVLAV